mgnify:CR=1 FL=1
MAMKAIPFLALLFMLISSSVFAADDDRAYRLRPGDAVLISVWREEALQREVRVLPDGSLTFPLAGRVEVAGLTTVQVEAELASRLRKYLAEPIVTVVVTAIDGNQVYVIGRVNRPGPVVLNGPMTVMQALSMAGGLDTFASGNSIRIVRTSAGKEEVLPVRYDDLIKGQNLKSNVLLKPGDTILVP